MSDKIWVAGEPVATETVKKSIRGYAVRGTIDHYDGVGIPPSHSNGIVESDLRRTWWVRARIFDAHHAEWIQLGASAPWDLLPAAAHLGDDGDAPDIITGACTLYDHFWGPQRKAARVSKVLHLKRPHFYPVLDAVVWRLYWPRAIRHLEQTGGHKAAAIWLAVREDLVHPQTQSAIADLRAWAGDEGGAMEAVGKLSDVRLLDIVAWDVAAHRA